MLTRRSFCTFGSLTLSAGQARRLPNIVYILADDFGWGDLTCYNPESRIRTRALDQLAAQGVCFTGMHSPSAVCTSTR
ncbi:MAG: sulfatase-like hydrolase/transferase [Bryobacterales bacterium]|nr:sulfatase-like hydrolase/transferase [Bryobacterales bacterium]